MTKTINIIMTICNDDNCKITIHKREDAYEPYAVICTVSYGAKHCIVKKASHDFSLYFVNF